jgi:SAM-dependent methyltransferase
MAGVNLCCGIRPIKGFLNVDKVYCPEFAPDRFAQVAFEQVDLNVRPWPFDDEMFDTVVMRDGLEHLDGDGGAFVYIMEEIWRILTPGGEAAIQVPNAATPNAFTDPTHRMYFTEFSFDYFDPATTIGTLLPHYSKCKFKIAKKHFADGGAALQFTLRKMPCSPL